MTILITGGLGKTSSVIAEKLHSAKIPFIVASRSGKVTSAPYKAVEFDWYRPETFNSPFDADAHIDSVYLVIPEPKQVNGAKSFIEFSRSRGVKRFVLMSASQGETEGFHLAGLQQYFADIGMEYAVLKPTWFQENFSTNRLTSIRDDDRLVSATADGRIPFVSTEDIADVVVDALTADKSLNSDLYIFGPELLSYEEASALNRVAEIFSKILGRKISFHRVTVAELRNFYASQLNLDDGLATPLSNMEGDVADRLEERLFNTSAKKNIGKITLESYISKNREVWLKN